MAGAFHPSAFDDLTFDVDYSTSSALHASIAGVERACGRGDDQYRVLVDSLKISDIADDTPNRAAFEAMGFVPDAGARVIIALGGLGNPDRLFAGNILSVSQGYVTDNPVNQQWAVASIDDTNRLNARKVIGQFTGTADDIVLELMATYAPSFTTDNVVADLPLIDGGITFTNQNLTDCLTQLAKRIGGYWYLDYLGDLHFFLSESAGSPSDQPTPIDADHPTVRNIRIARDLSQVVTRVFVEGGGGTALAEVAAAETILPVNEITWYSLLGGTVISGPQRFNYASYDPGGGGSLVGTGAKPDAAPMGELADGAGVEDGEHAWAYTFVTADGETLPSPLLTMTVGSVPAPTVAPVAGAPTVGSGVTTGPHYYAFTYKTAIGETTAGPNSNTVTPGPVTTGLINPPSASPGLSTTPFEGNTLITVKYAVTFTNGVGETTAGPTASVQVLGFEPPSASVSLINLGTGNIAAGSYTWYITVVNSVGAETVVGTGSGGSSGGSFSAQYTFASPASNSGATAYKFYRTTNGGSTPKLVGQTASSSDTSFIDDVPDGSLGANAPSTNGTYASVSVGLAIGGSGTTGRKVYATEPGLSQLKLLATISNNTATSTTDTNPRNTARLGANVPTSNTTSTTTNYNQVPLTLPEGPGNCTHIGVYRTEASGSQLKLVAYVVNGTLSYLDTTADGSLGANIPVANTADANQVDLEIPLGPTGTTARNVYRTEAGDTQLKLVDTIADNVTTPFTDDVADASLGADAPTSDDSLLDQPTGQVNAGSTEIPVATTALFPSEGWAILTAGQVIRYSGKTANTLTGVPATGPGSLQGTVNFNSPILAAPQLTGITSGSPSAGSITYTIPKGQDVNLLVQVDSTSAQAVIGALVTDDDGNPTDGIIEAYVQDRRLSEAEARARGQAYLDLYSTIETTLTYQVRNDFKTKAGRLVDVDLTSPMEISGTFKIQSVDLSFLATTDTETEVFFDVTASTTRFSFEDLLRQVRSLT